MAGKDKLVMFITSGKSQIFTLKDLKELQKALSAKTRLHHINI